jgi:hypothetical protein
MFAPASHRAKAQPMVWSSRESDPTTDRAAFDVLAAYEIAEKAGLPPVACYRAGVEAWRRAHPEQTRKYAAGKAVTIILANKVSLRIEDA